MSEVLLISMPYGAVDRPALGISLLKSILRERGIARDIRYLNFAFAGIRARNSPAQVSTSPACASFSIRWWQTI